MRPPLNPAILLIGLLLLAVIHGMVGAWIWAFRRWRRREPFFAEPKPGVVPWGAGSVSVVVVAWFAVNLGVGLLYFLAIKGGLAAWKPGAPKPTAGGNDWTFSEQMLLVTLSNGLLLALIPPILKATSGARLADFGLKTAAAPRQFRDGLMAFLLISPIVYACNALAVLIWVKLSGTPQSHPLEKMIRNEMTVGSVELAILSAVILAPAAEELIFRGIIQGWLTRLFQAPAPPVVEIAFEGSFPSAAVPLVEIPYAAPPTSAFEPLAMEAGVLTAPTPAIRPTLLRRMAPIVLTSGLFALVHLPQWPAPIAIFFLSLGLGYTFERTGSLIASFTMHALFNGLGNLLLFAAILGGVGSAPTPSLTPSLPSRGGKVEATDSAKTGGSGGDHAIDDVESQRTSNPKRFSIGASNRD